MSGSSPATSRLGGEDRCAGATLRAEGAVPGSGKIEPPLPCFQLNGPPAHVLLHRNVKEGAPELPAGEFNITQVQAAAAGGSARPACRCMASGTQPPDRDAPTASSATQGHEDTREAPASITSKSGEGRPKHAYLREHTHACTLQANFAAEPARLEVHAWTAGHQWQLLRTDPPCRAAGRHIGRRGPRVWGLWNAGPCGHRQHSGRPRAAARPAAQEPAPILSPPAGDGAFLTLRMAVRAQQHCIPQGA